MSIFEKQRWEIWNLTQHPYRHSLGEFSYANPALPGVTNVESALNYILAVLYPQTQPNVPTPGDLPTVGNTIGDYRVVDDDGDGKSAGYRWEQREGDVAPQWYKIFDVDWSTDAILAAVTNVTDDKYFFSKGKDDLDELGDPVTGLYAGQLVYGGASANTNLTLNANSGDGVGPQTGFVQIDSNFRPTVDNTYDLSTATERWKDAYFAGTVSIGTMSISSGSIIDSSGSIDFDDENLTTTGNISGAVVTGSSLVADDTTDTMTLVPGSITDTTGAIAFGAANLSTTGTLGAGVATFTDGGQTLIIDPDNGSGRASITASHGSIDFNDEDLYTTGAISVGAITGTLLNIDNITIDGNTVSSTDTNGNIILLPNGTGLVDIQKLLQTLDIATTGTHTITGILNVDNLRLDGNSLISTNANGNILIDPNGTGVIEFASNFIPTSSGSFDIGSSSALLNDIFLSGGIRNASNEISINTLLAFRSGVWRDLAQTQPAQNGDSLFYDFANGVWLASTPDSEIDHSTISGLTTGDAGHTQFALLTGRVGGQTIQGGTAASELLILESTSNATKGTVRTADSFLPNTDATFSAGWNGLDLGGSSNYFRDVYTKGEHFGFRLENVLSSGLPASSAQNIGRLVYETDTSKIKVDTGTQFKVAGISKFVADQIFNGTDLVKNVDVSSEITDARNAIFALLDNANDFEKLGVVLKATSATNVRIETSIPLPAGSYRLIVIE